jgi:3-oxoadipate enol-lactonase
VIVAPCELYHETAGVPDAPTVVFAPSLGTRLSIWDPQARELEARFQTVRCDLRGHGRSDVPKGPYSIAGLGRDLLGLLDRLELRRASLCGISIGAMGCMWVAANAPDRVERLVVCCSSAAIGAGDRYRARAAAVRARGMEVVADEVLERWFTPRFRGRHPEVVERMRSELIATPAEGYASCCEALAEMDLRAELDAITAPMLVVAGQQDDATPPEHGALIADAVRGARFEVVPDAAHLANIEQPEAVGALIADHLDATEKERT